MSVLEPERAGAHGRAAGSPGWRHILGHK